MVVAVVVAAKLEQFQETTQWGTAEWLSVSVSGCRWW